MKLILVVFSFFVSASLNAQESGTTFCSVDISVNDSNKYQMLMWTVAGKNIVYRGHVDNLLTLAQAKNKLQTACPRYFPKEAHGECYLEEQLKIGVGYGYGLYQKIPVRVNEDYDNRWFRAWSDTKGGAEALILEFQKMGICPRN